jgi:pilus retraction protein PilT
MSTFVDELIKHACDYVASDLFLCEETPGRIKVAGQLHPCGDQLVTRADMIEFWERCGIDPSKQTDMDAAYRTPQGARFRVNFHRQSGRLAAVLRLIKTTIPALGSLGLPAELLEQWLQRTSGLVLITGPTGSGKSTTMAASLDWINERMPKHIVTIEDPVEFEFIPQRSYFTQREVGTDTPTFAAALRSALRQAPDILFLGEIRDAETALIALQASETGHLVFGTLHSSTVTDAIERFVHLVDTTSRASVQALLAYQLIGVLSQQLLPNRDGDGLVLICEHLHVQAAVRDWIRELKMEEIREFMRREDSIENTTFLETLATAYEQNLITYETALAHCGNAYEFTRRLRGVS